MVLLVGPGLAAASGAVWTNNGPPGAVVQSIAEDPTSNSVLYAGTRNGGVFKAEPGGPTTWRAVNTGLGNLDVRSIEASPATSGVVLAGTGAGIYRTANGGGSWELVPGPPAEAIEEIAFDPTAPATVYAVSFSGWIGKSTNGGASWQALGGPASSQRPQAVTVDPTHGATVYVGTLDDGVYKSEDGGATWTERNEGLLNLHVSAIVVSPTEPSNVYVGIDNGGAFLSTDGGASWETFNNNLQGTGVNALAADSDGRVYLANSLGVWALLEGGFPGWGLLEAVPNPNALDVGPGDPGILWVGFGQLPQTQGGVAFAEDRSTFFLAPFDGLNGVTIASLAIDPADPTRILTAGTMTGWVSDDGGGTWTPGSTPGFGLSLAFDPQAPGVVYEGVAGGVQKSSDGGASWAVASTGLPANPLVRALLDLPGSAGVLLAGTTAGVYRTADAGANWAAPGTAVPTVVFSLARDPSSPTIWAGAEDGVYRSTDEGVTWSLAGSATSAPVYSVLDSAVAAPKIFAGTGAGLLVSSDGGSSWSAVGAGLPAAEVFALVEDPGRSAIYAGGAAGVFVSSRRRRELGAGGLRPDESVRVGPRGFPERRALRRCARRLGFPARRDSDDRGSRARRALRRPRLAAGSRAAALEGHPIASIAASARADFLVIVARVRREAHGSLAGRDDDAAFFEILRPAVRVAARRGGGENPRSERLRRRDPPASSRQTVGERAHERENTVL